MLFIAFYPKNRLNVINNIQMKIMEFPQKITCVIEKKRHWCLLRGNERKQRRKWKEKEGMTCQWTVRRECCHKRSFWPTTFESLRWWCFFQKCKWNLSLFFLSFLHFSSRIFFFTFLEGIDGKNEEQKTETKANLDEFHRIVFFFSSKF